MTDRITLSHAVADGISLAISQDVYTCESPERMAWIVLLLRKMEDKEIWFPRGKWATIQSIEAQLNKATEEFVENMD